MVGWKASNFWIIRESGRVSKLNTANRDLMIYLVWQLGVANNQEIGEKFGLTYSAVIRRVGILKQMLIKNKGLKIKYRQIKSLIRI